MTARTLQRELVRDLTEYFRSRRYKIPDGGTRAPKVYPQALPLRESGDETDVFPYIIIRLDSGEIPSQTEPHNVTVLALVGVYDEEPQQQGHITVLEILEAIQERFQEEPTLAGRYKITGPFQWALQQEESYPYYFGAATMVFQAPPPRLRKSEFT